MKPTVTLLGFVLIVFGAGLLNAQFPPDEWYDLLQKPSWTLPAWTTGPVWTILYALIALSGWMVWLKRGFHGHSEVWLAYLAQLILNAIWSFLFIGLRQPALAVLDVAMLIVAVLSTIVAFERISRAASFMLLPYLAWVGYTACFNFTVWQLNP